MATTIVASIYKEQLSRRRAVHVAVIVNRAAGLTLLFGIVVVFGLLSVPSLSEVWPAFLAAATILTVFVYCGYLTYKYRQAPSGDVLS